jgi:uncharacterized protein YndB with AHSA1/START domain
VTEPPQGISIVRVFDAPRELVWKEWTEPERFADWFGAGGCVIPVETVAIDLRPGGSWRATMLCDDGAREIQWTGEYREVEAPERLVLTFSDRPGGDGYELVTVVLTDLGDGRTEMQFRQEGEMRAAGYERAREGWSSFFDRLAERVLTA